MRQTIKCPICGEPYTVHMHTVADQSACPDCMAKASRKSKTWLSNNTNGPVTS